MAVSIPEFLQNPDYSAKQFRSISLDSFGGSGVVNAADLKVSQRGAGANMSVDIATGPVWVAGSTARQGLYHFYNDAIINKAVNANASGNPRVDQIIARVYDSTDGGSVSDSADIEYLPGTATAGAQITARTGANYRSGAAALPSHSIVLADILVANGAASITNANIVDRRPWAFGAFQFYQRTAGNYTVATTTATEMDTTYGNIRNRIECSGYPMRITLSGFHSYSVAGGIGVYTPRLDGANIGPGALLSVGTSIVPFHLEYYVTPSAGMHEFTWMFNYNALGAVGTLTTRADATYPLVVSYEEIRRPDASNN